jgi:hypothetical protein
VLYGETQIHGVPQMEVRMSILPRVLAVVLTLVFTFIFPFSTNTGAQVLEATL